MTKTERTILTVDANGRVSAIYLEPAWPQDQSPWIWTWKAIGAAVGRSERWARRLGRAGGMPVTWVEGRPGITKAALYGWLKSLG